MSWMNDGCPERVIDPPEGRRVCSGDCDLCHVKNCDCVPPEEDDDDSMTMDEIIAWANQPHDGDAKRDELAEQQPHECRSATMAEGGK